MERKTIRIEKSGSFFAMAMAVQILTLILPGTSHGKQLCNTAVCRFTLNGQTVYLTPDGTQINRGNGWVPYTSVSQAPAAPAGPTYAPVAAPASTSRLAPVFAAPAAAQSIEGGNTQDNVGPDADSVAGNADGGPGSDLPTEFQRINPDAHDSGTFYYWSSDRCLHHAPPPPGVGTLPYISSVPVCKAWFSPQQAACYAKRESVPCDCDFTREPRWRDPASWGENWASTRCTPLTPVEYRGNVTSPYRYDGLTKGAAVQ